MTDHTYGTMVWHTCGHMDTFNVTQSTQSAICQREGSQPCEYCRTHPEQEPLTPEEIDEIYRTVFAD